MTATKTNEREGTRAVLRNSRISATKVRVVLDLIRGKQVVEARDILRFCERDAALLVGKLLASAVANAEHNDGLDPDDLFVSACYADEGTTMKRWRPRARGRATRIRKRSSHVTVIVSRLPEDRLARARAKQAADLGAHRARRVEGGRKPRPTRRDAKMPGTAPAPETAVVPETEATPAEAPPAEVESPEVTAVVEDAEATEAVGTDTTETPEATEAVGTDTTETPEATEAPGTSEQTEAKGE